MALNQSWRRRLTYGSNASVVTVVGLAVMALLYVAAMESRVRWDFTEEGRNTLSPDMQAKLALLDADGETVQITAFTAQRGHEDASVKNAALGDLLQELGTQSTTVDWRLVDFDRERLTAERLGVSEYSHVVVQRGQGRVDIRARDLFRRMGSGDQRRVAFMGETAFARAFSQLHTPKRRVVYVLAGHGERDSEDRGPSGMSDFADALDIERYEVEPLNLLAAVSGGSVPVVPEDAAVVLVAGASAKLASHETDALISFASRGGGLMFAVDPDRETPELLVRLGVGIQGGVATDQKVMFPFWDRPIPVIRKHGVTEGLMASNLAPVLAHVAPLSLADPLPTGVKGSSILVTSRRGWVERGGELVAGAPRFDEGVDGVGPVDMAVALELRPGSDWVRAGKPPARVLVVGDSDFLGNHLFSDGPGNSTLALDSVHWLAGADLRVASVGARRQKVRRLAISKNELETLRWVSLGVLPVLVGLFGFAVRFGRRGR
jgi:hypothetical protein